MANKNFIVKNGLEVGGQEVVSSSGVVTSAALGGQTLSSTDSPTFNNLTVSNDLSVSGDLNLTGDLNITGDVNSLSVTDLDVTDQTITLGAGQVASASGGSGIIVDGSSASILWDETNTSWDFNESVEIAAGKNIRVNTVNNAGNTANIIYRSSTNTIVGNNASALVVQDGGNVGIGTTSPQNNSGRTTLTLSNSTNGGILEIFGASDTRQLLIYNSTGESRFETLSGGSEDIVFIPNGSESVRFDSSGNVGIGTDNPRGNLEIESIGVTNLYLTRNDSTINDTNSLGVINFSGTEDGSTYINGAQIYAKAEVSWSAGDYKTGLAFSTNLGNSLIERMRIDSSGNVGIGTTSPNGTGFDGNATVLSVNGYYRGMIELGSNNNVIGDMIGGIEFRNTTVTEAYVRAYRDSSGDSEMRLAAHHFNFTSGNVGIGLDNPLNKFVVAHQSHGVAIDYVGATLPYQAGLFTSSSALTQTAYGDLNIKSRSDYTTYGIGFFTADVANTPTLRMKISNTGNVGIGNTSPRTDLNFGFDHYTPSPGESDDRILNWYSPGGELHNSKIYISAVSNSVETSQPQHIGLALANKNTTDNNWSPAITFGGLSKNGNYMNGGAAIASQNYTGTNDANFIGSDLHFFTKDSASSAGRNLASKMVIGGNGNVGIGTTDPVSELQVLGTVASGTATKPTHAVYDASSNMRSFEHVFSATKGTTGVATNKTLVDVSGLSNFHQAIFIVEYGTRLQAVSDSVTGFVHRAYAINRFNGGSLNVTETTAIAGSSNSLAHALIDVEVVSNTQYRIRVEFSSSISSSSFASGTIRAYGVGDYFPTISFAEGIGNS